MAWIAHAVALGLSLTAATSSDAQEATSPRESWSAAELSIARGEALFGVRNYDAALAEFLAAYDQLSAHPRQYMVLYNIAACHERMFRYDAALEYYRRYLLEGGANAEDLVKVESVVRSLESLLASLTVTTNIESEIWIDGRLVGRAPGKLRLPPGKHVLELRAALYESERREFSVTAGSSQELRFVLERLSRYRGLHPVAFWAGSGLCLAALTTGVVFGARALAAHDSGEARRRDDPFLNTVANEREIRRMSRVADVSFASAAVLGVGSIALFFLTDWSAEAAPTEPLRAECSFARAAAACSLRRRF